MARARKPVAAVLALLATAVLAHLLSGPDSIPQRAAAQDVSSGDCAGDLVVTLRMGIGDGAPTDWSGAASGWSGVEPVSWQRESESKPLKQAGGEGVERIVPASVDLELPMLPCGSEIPSDSSVRVETTQGSFEFAPLQVVMGRPLQALDGRVSVERVPSAVPVASESMEEDFPDCTALADGSVLCAFVSYAPGAPIDETAALSGDFSSIEFDGNGDRVVLIGRGDSGWSAPIDVTSPGRDIWRPVVTALPGNRAAVLWSEQREGNWDLFAREYDPSSTVLGPERRLTSDPGPDFNVAASGGIFAWQARRGDGFDIFASRLGGTPVLVSTSEANDWRPSIATDSSGAAWIAWDSYDAGNYDVLLRRFDGEAQGPAIPIAASPRFEARASVAVDGRDRVWIAFEDSEPDWGKDSGDRWPGAQATSMYLNRNILVRVWDGTLRETLAPPKAPPVDTYHDDPRVATSQQHRISIPRIAFDGRGRPWVLFRRHPLPTGRGERWRSYAVHYDGGTWSDPIALRTSDHLLDRQPGLAALRGGGLMALLPGDKRKQNVRDREHGDLFESLLEVDSVPSESRLTGADASRPLAVRPPIHPDEAFQIARMRTQRVIAAGKQLRFLRGEFHRHTEFSAHRDWDGPFEDVWRYGMDVAGLDWIGPGDHDYAVGDGYLWWLQQKASDIYNAPGRFTAAYTYERNTSYPSGHRNVMLPRRGIRPLPRMRGRDRIFGTAENGSADIRNLFAYLRHFGGICSSHTSATNMGTDWRDGDPLLEPVVELFQGHRQNYEYSGAPRAATGPDDTIQGYRPLGFVWEAFKKGRRLGFQASSDHVSTHISYAVVLAEGNSRSEIIQAFQRRHSYAAQDNIALVVRSGDRLMGEEFVSEAIPRLRVVATGTAAIERVDIVRQVGRAQPEVIASMTPGETEIDLDWSDPAAVPGEWNMYYVRVEQANRAMAWASPLWIRYEH